MTPTPPPPELPDVPCNELVELVTDYLDGALTAPRRAEVDAHVAICASSVCCGARPGVRARTR